jgi:hypothetical protein
MIKRIISGRTYNSETSLLLGEEINEVPATDWFDLPTTSTTHRRLYQTKMGAFWLHETIDHTSVSYDSELGEAIYPTERLADKTLSLGRAEARKWLLEREGAAIIVHQNPFHDPPEASAEDDESDVAEPEAILYLRIAPALKAAVERAAKKDGVSVNAWAASLLQQSLSEVRAP